jgi:hypothetical protein
MNNNITALTSKISLPVIITVLGLALVIIGKASDQNNMFLISTGLLTIAGLVMLFFSVGSNIGKIAVLLGGVLGIAGFVTFFYIGNDIISIDNARKYDERMDELVKQNLNDIKTSQIAYKELNGTYAKDWSTLREFIVNGKIKIAVKNGGVPNRRLTAEERAIIYGAADKRALDYNMTEAEAIILAKSANPPADLKGFVRDTMLTSFYETSFGASSYVSRRTKMGFPEFNVDSIFYIPNTGKQFFLTVTDSVEFQGTKVQALLVSGERVLKSTGKTMFYSFGSTSSPALSTNWD